MRYEFKYKDNPVGPCVGWITPTVYWHACQLHTSLLYILHVFPVAFCRITQRTAESTDASVHA